MLKRVWECCVVAPNQEISIRCITLSEEFKDFKDDFQNSWTFQGHSKIFPRIQGPFNDQHEIKGFQGFFSIVW